MHPREAERNVSYFECPLQARSEFTKTNILVQTDEIGAHRGSSNQSVQQAANVMDQPSQS